MQGAVPERGHLEREGEGGGLPQAGVQGRGGAHLEGEEEDVAPEAVEKYLLQKTSTRSRKKTVTLWTVPWR